MRPELLYPMMLLFAPTGVSTVDNAIDINFLVSEAVLRLTGVLLVCLLRRCSSGCAYVNTDHYPSFVQPALNKQPADLFMQPLPLNWPPLAASCYYYNQATREGSLCNAAAHH